MSTHMTNGRKVWRPVGALAGAAVMLAACSSLLDVKNPNDVSESALTNPTAATAMTNGVLAATVRMLSGITVPYSVATDELDWIGSRDAWNDLETGAVSNISNEFTDGAFPYVGEARYLANATMKRLVDFDAAGTLTNRTLLAQTYLYGAIVYASIADMYDDYAYSDKTNPAKPIGRAQMGTMYDSAVTYLDKAYAIAGPGTNTTLKYQIMAYRARVKHAKAVWAKITPEGATAPANPLVNDAGANTDAAAALALAAAADQKFYIQDNLEATAGINIWFEVNGRNEHRTGTAYRTLNDPVTAALDPTAQTLLSLFTVSGGPTPAPAGAPTQSGTFTITSNRELHLILAEAQLAQGNTANFRTELNIVRAYDSKPAYTGTPVTDVQMLQHERRAQLWLMRRRLSDMYRFGAKDPKWAPNPNLKSAYETVGLLFPIPHIERIANPCIEDATKCP